MYTYKGWTAEIISIEKSEDDAGVMVVIFKFTKGDETNTYTERMSKIDPQIARDKIDLFEEPAETAKATADEIQRVADQEAYVAVITANPPLGYFDLG